MAPPAPELQLLTPASRPLRRLPKPALWVLGAAVGMNLLLGPKNGGLTQWANGFVLAAAILAACSCGAWLEEQLYAGASSFTAGKRLFLALVIPPAGFLGGLLGGLVLGIPLGLLGLDPTAAAAWLLGGLWVGLAGVGSLTVVMLDVVVSAIARDFRSRIVLAVVGLVTLTTGLAATCALLGTQALALLAAKGPHLVGGNADFTIAGEPLISNGVSLLDQSSYGPISVVLACLAGLLGLPVLLSACCKLADAVMERLRPLSQAFAEVAQGNLAVSVEEAGSEDFVRLSAAFNGMAGSLALAKKMDRAYGAYLGKQVAARIKAQHGEAVLPASSRVISVFFADIRGFTSMSERLEPSQVLSILNRYFERVVAIIDAHEGYLNKFIGDAVVVVFNAPLDQPDHPERAVRCAIAIQEEVRAMNAAGAFGEVGGLRVGVGVASGPVVAGNLGSEKQMEYTVIGDTVNLAARLTSQAPAGEVWVNAASAAALPESLARVELAALKLKGKEQPVTPYRVWPR